MVKVTDWMLPILPSKFIKELRMSIVYWLHIATPLTPQQVLERVAQQPSASPVEKDTSYPNLVGYTVEMAGMFVSTHEWMDAAAADDEEVDDLEPSIEATFGFAPTHLLRFHIKKINGAYQRQGIVDVVTTAVVLAHAPHGGMVLLEELKSVLLWQPDRWVLDHAILVWEPDHLQLLPEPYTFESLKQF